MNTLTPTPDRHPDPDLLAALAEAPHALGTEDRTRLEAHLEGCLTCREEVRWIRELRDAAQDLPREVAPPPHLFEEVRSRIEAGEGGRAPRIGEAPTVPTRFPVAWLSAAALLLVALSSGLTLHLARGGSDAPPPLVASGVEGEAPGGHATTPASPTGNSEGMAPRSGGTTHLAAHPSEVVGTLEDAWGPTLALLETALLRGRSSLQPETLEVLDESLRVIDQAMAEARAALETDPASSEAARALNGAYENRVRVLQQVTSLLPEA
jgi:hypothetical protein